MSEDRNAEGILLPVTDCIDLPKIKPIRLGEYGRALEKLWVEFERIRKNGIYAADRNLAQPSFSDKFVLHGLAGRFAPNGGEFIFTPPNPSTVKKICNIGITSSDVEFDGDAPRSYSEEETFGTADFFTMDKPMSSVSELMAYLRRRVGLGNEYITAVDDSPESATLMFAFDSSRPELAPLMEHSMKDNQPEETLWANGFGNHYINFSMKGSGLHMAVPIGLPANFLEYIVVNEQSPHWQGSRFNQLREAAVCDGHIIPLVSVVSGTIIGTK